TALVVSGPTKAVRIGTASDGTYAAIDGVDNTGTNSFQPLHMTASEITLNGRDALGLQLVAGGVVRAPIRGDVGFFKAANQNNWYDPSGLYHEMSSGNPGPPALVVHHSHSGNPRGLTVQYSNGAPNSPGNYFITCGDNQTDRFYVGSNGGVI